MKLLPYLLLNMKFIFVFVAITLLFILYWAIFPDNTTGNAIMWTLIADGTLLTVIAGILTILWKRNRPKK